MKTIRIFRHVAWEGPGYLSEFLKQRHRPFEIVKIDAGENVPGELDDVSALVFMGGPMSVNDNLSWIDQELNLIRRAHERHIPMLGHCLGGQLLAKALGGSVGPNPVKEIGWHDVEQLDNSAAHDWLTGIPQRFTAYHWHGETFHPPQDATTILKSAHCDRQAFVIDNTLALQCHVEMTGDMVTQWAEINAKQIASPSATVQGKADMLALTQTHLPAMQACADTLYARWLQGVAHT